MSCQLKFLLIDDNEWELYYHQELLLLNGLDCETENFSSADLALKYLNNLGEKMNPHVILCDINMPNMNGFEFIEQFSKLPPHIKNKINLFMISAIADNEEIKKAKSYNCVKCVFPKPLNVETLLDNIGFYQKFSMGSLH